MLAGRVWSLGAVSSLEDSLRSVGLDLIGASTSSSSKIVSSADGEMQSDRLPDLQEESQSDSFPNSLPLGSPYSHT